MKRTMAVLMAALLLMGLAACDGGEDPAVGKYSFSHMEAMGMTLDAAAMEAFGMDASGFTLEMKADGTFVMNAFPTGDGAETEDGEDSGEGTWEKSGDAYTLTVEGDSISATYDKNAKTMSMTFDSDGEEGTMVFKK